jgi:ABC-type sugar transport system permease subunit
MLIFSLYLLPAILSIVMSFERQVGLITVESIFKNISLDPHNYIRGLKDPVWRNAFFLTLELLALIIGTGLSVSLVIAMILSENFRGRAIFRTILLIPWAVPPIVNGTIWGLILHSDIGTLNALLKQLGIIGKSILWLSSPSLALFMIGLAVIWRSIPFMTLFILAGLQSIPSDLYKSAEVDRANAFNRFRYITLPSIRNILIVIASIQSIWSARVFDEIWALTRGGPSNGTTVMNVMVFKQTFEFLDFGYGSALAYQLASFTAVFVFLYLFSLRKAGDETIAIET